MRHLSMHILCVLDSVTLFRPAPVLEGCNPAKLAKEIFTTYLIQICKLQGLIGWFE